MDYRELLKSYMRSVMAQEGVSFVSDMEHSYDQKMSARLTPEMLVEIRAIETEVEADIKKDYPSKA